MPPESATSIFIVSARYAAEISAICAGYGWRATIAEGLADAGSAFVIDHAAVALVDARGASRTIVETIRVLGAAVDRCRGALLVLLDGDDPDAIDNATDAGATHVVAGPVSARQIAAAIRLAFRMCDRLAAAAVAAGVRQLNARPSDLATAAKARSWVETLIALDDAPDPAAIVLQLAIGRFGQLNAAYGRNVADAALVEVEQRLRHAAATMAIDGQSDGPTWATRIVTRLAGAEFALILAPPATLANAAELGRHIAATFDPPFVIDGHSIHLGCRIGIAAESPTDSFAAAAAAAERVFRHASIALAAARARPPGAIEVFHAPVGVDPMRRMADLESDLRSALATGEVDLLFQPQVDLVSGRIVGVEALVRWQHPVFGQLPAETLLNVAKSAEVATRLGTYIQRQALTIGAQWPPTLDGLRLAVNATGPDLADPAFLMELDAALAASGFPPSRLTIEITESDLIENLDAAAIILAAVRGRGIEVALDDFGTGYSSLAYLKTLPLDCLKVDKHLVSDLAGSARDSVVVKGVVDMARALGIGVVAEGVETEEQRARVAAAGCDWYQGFLCAAPMNAHALAAFVAGWDGGPALRAGSRPRTVRS